MNLAQVLVKDPDLIRDIHQNKLVTDNLKDLHFNPVQLNKQMDA